MSEAPAIIGLQSWAIEDVQAIVQSRRKIAVGDDAMEKVKACRAYLDGYIDRDADPVYGVNTGFGALCDTVIGKNDLSKLQENLVKSHACGTGQQVHSDIVRLMLLLKIKGLSLGHSGIHPETLQRLVDMYNADALPIVYEFGSLGASGDLAPLAHMSLPLIGLGEVECGGQRMGAAELLKKMNWAPLELRSKEGLALLNGTQFMTAFGVNGWLLAHQLVESADLIGALSLDAYRGRSEPFHPAIHSVRPHPGQKETAENIRHYLEGSAIQQMQKQHVQDPYSFRCMPQVHGATRDVLAFVKEVLEREINAVTDNPTVFPDEDLVLSAGNFHGQPLALALDQLAIAMAEIGSISERRTYKLLSGTRGLPAFLVAEPGLNSGLMIPQYTAASIVSKNKQLCTPASIDTIDSSNGQEDHVSMGANAAVKSAQVIHNVARILGIELLNAAQAMDLRRPEQTSPALETLHANFRAHVPFVSNDTTLYPMINEAYCFVFGLKAYKYR